MAAPANDNFADAVVVGALPYTAPSVNITDATVQSGEPTGDTYVVFHTAWWAWTAPSNASVVAQATGTDDWSPRIHVYTGAWGSLTFVGGGYAYGTAAWVKFSATAGTTYYFQVGGRTLYEYGALTFRLAETPPAPDNDTCATATVVTLPLDVTVNTLGATDDPAFGEWEGNCSSGNAYGGVWYQVTTGPSANALYVQVWDEEEYSTWTMFRGDACGALTYVDCYYAGDSASAVTVLPSTTYYFLVTYYRAGGAPAIRFMLSAPAGPAANDDCANAKEIGALPYSDTVDTTGCGDDTAYNALVDVCGPAVAYHGVWYRWVCPEGVYRANDWAEPSEAVVTVFTGTCGALTLATRLTGGMYADYGTCSQPYVFTPGTTYYFLVTSDVDGGYPALTFHLDPVAASTPTGQFCVDFTAPVIPVVPPVNTTQPCGCGNGGGAGAAPWVDNTRLLVPYWHECVGGGTVPNASDVSDSESWDPQ